MIREIKNQQDGYAHKIKEEIRTGMYDSVQYMQQKMQAFSIGIHNHENVNPNFRQYSSVYTSEQYQDPPSVSFHLMEQHNNAFVVTQHN